MIDTNILLDLIEFNTDVASEIIDVLEKCSFNLFIPNQVKNEYEENKLRTFTKSIHVSEVIKDIEKLEELTNNFQKKYEESYLKYNNIQKPLSTLEKNIINFKDNLKNTKDQLKVEKSTREAEKRKILERIDNLVKRSNVGTIISIKSQVEIMKEGEIRYRYKIPPGYMDKDKNHNKFGDLFIWYEILEIPKDYTTPIDIVFLTNDSKEDWIDVKSNKIRNELEVDFKAHNNSGSSIRISNLPDFLHSQGLDVSKIESIKNIVVCNIVKPILYNVMSVFDIAESEDLDLDIIAANSYCGLGYVRLSEGYIEDIEISNIEYGEEKIKLDVIVYSSIVYSACDNEEDDIFTALQYNLETEAVVEINTNYIELSNLYYSNYEQLYNGFSMYNRSGLVAKYIDFKIKSSKIVNSWDYMDREWSI